MQGCHLILFDEKLHDQFPGFPRNVPFSSIPMWGNFTVKDILELSNIGAIRHSVFSISRASDLVSLNVFLRREGTGRMLLLGRKGNITILDWGSISGEVMGDMMGDGMGSCGIVKVQVGKVPSDLYIISRDDFLQAVERLQQKIEEQHDRFVQLLFDEYLFHNFERVVKTAGSSYLLRNAFEYFQENLRYAGYFRNEGFRTLFMHLKTSHVSDTTVTDQGVVKSSFIGAGAKIDGLVENSTIFHDVVVERGAWVRNAVILPSNIVEEGAAVENALILSGKGRIIGRNSIVGGASDINNADYPSILKKGLTIVGEEVPVPASSTIGSGCLVMGRGSGVHGPLVIRDGETCRL